MRKGFIRNSFYTKPKKGLEFVANCRTLFWFRIIPFFFSVRQQDIEYQGEIDHHMNELESSGDKKNMKE
jgi:hypothetical protein